MMSCLIIQIFKNNLGTTSQTYKLHKFVSNSHGISCFMGSCFLHMDFMSLKHMFCMYNYNGIFHVDDNIPLYLYTHHTCFNDMKFLCKKHELMK